MTESQVDLIPNLEFIFSLLSTIYFFHVSMYFLKVVLKFPKKQITILYSWSTYSTGAVP